MVSKAKGNISLWCLEITPTMLHDCSIGVYSNYPNALGYFQHTYRGLPLQIPL